MEVIIFCITLTALMAMCLVVVGMLIGRSQYDKGTDNVDNKSMDERTDVSDSNNVSDVCGRDRCRSGDNGCLERMDAETAINALSVMRMSVKYSETEKAAIEYAMECIEIAHKLADYWKGETE